MISAWVLHKGCLTQSSLSLCTRGNNLLTLNGLLSMPPWLHSPRLGWFSQLMGTGAKGRCKGLSRLLQTNVERRNLFRKAGLNFMCGVNVCLSNDCFFPVLAHLCNQTCHHQPTPNNLHEGTKKVKSSSLIARRFLHGLM